MVILCVRFGAHMPSISNTPIQNQSCRIEAIQISAAGASKIIVENKIGLMDLMSNQLLYIFIYIYKCEIGVR